MENLDLLEERVRRVTELVRSLRRENAELQTQLRASEERTRKTGETLASLQEEKRRGEELSRQLRLLQEERQEIRGRVSRMLEAVASLDEMQPTGHPDN
jgi:chromosome segregation ATPase